jgi:hypothetical protein
MVRRALVASLTLVATMTAANAGAQENSGFRIRADHDAVVVKLVSKSANAKDIQSALRHAGINAKVIAVAASPSFQGQWLGATQRGSGVPWVIDHDDPTRAVVPRKQKHLGLRLGRAARAHETYSISRSAFCPGEPLAGSGIENLSTSEAEARIDNIGLSVSWRLTTTAVVDADGGHTSGTSEFVSQTPEGVITGASLISRRTLVVFVSPAGDYLAEHRGIPTTC